MVFDLMPDKTQSSYERLFSSIKTHNISLNPKTIMPDFDPCGGRNSLINMFIHLTRRPHTIISTRLKPT